MTARISPNTPARSLLGIPPTARTDADANATVSSLAGKHVAEFFAVLALCLVGTLAMAALLALGLTQVTP